MSDRPQLLFKVWMVWTSQRAAIYCVEQTRAATQGNVGSGTESRLNPCDERGASLGSGPIATRPRRPEGREEVFDAGVIAATTCCAEPWMPLISALISSVAAAVCGASVFTSVATTAEPGHLACPRGGYPG